MKTKLLLFFFLFGTLCYSQKQHLNLTAELDTELHQIEIQQEILFYNHSKDTLKSIYLHNWMNSYKDKKTPLSKRLLEDYNKDLYFAKEKNRGFSKILNISSTYESTAFKIDEKIPDIVKVTLNKDLAPNDSITLIATYIVKIPTANFTKYGRKKK